MLHIDYYERGHGMSGKHWSFINLWVIYSRAESKISLTEEFSFSNKAFVNNLIIFEETAFGAAFFHCLSGLHLGPWMHKPLNKWRNQLQHNAPVSKSWWWRLPPGNSPCNSAGSRESREERLREQVLYFPPSSGLWWFRRSWCGDYRGCEYRWELDNSMQPHRATWIQVFLSPPAEGKLKAEQPMGSSRSSFHLNDDAD